MKYHYLIDVPVNGKPRKAVVRVLDAHGKLVTTDEGNLLSAPERDKVARRLSKVTQDEAEEIAGHLNDCVTQTLSREGQREQERRDAAAHPDSLPEIEILDTMPECIRRPLCLVDGRAYAAAWLPLRTTVRQGLDDRGQPVTYDPPQRRTESVLAVLRDDGRLFADTDLEGAARLSELGVTVSLPSRVLPSRGWSGAGVRRFLAGERAQPADVFRRCAAVVDRFMDFSRSWASQQAMCELVACYVLATYLLDAFNVIGYLWPNGEPGSGKTNFLHVVCEMACLGQVILAGGSYATLRDLADYGACLAFDDAEGIMDVRKTDPDKRTLLLAGNRRGATVPVKELVGDTWQTRHINAFCPRAFSAIRLPDPVLATRTLVIPLVRSADRNKANADPLDHSLWPCDRRRLVDDLWAVGLAGLPALRAFDAQVAERSRFLGRELEPWRAVLAVALWLQESHGVDGLHDRMERLSADYQSERSDLEANSATRVAIKALQRMLAEQGGQRLEFAPKTLASAMNAIAVEEDLVEKPEDEFTTAKKVGWLLKRLRLSKGSRDTTRHWLATASDVEALAISYGMTTRPAPKREDDVETF